MKQKNKLYYLIIIFCGSLCACKTSLVTYTDYRLLFKEKIYRLSAYDTSRFTVQFTNFNTYELEVKKINDLPSGKYLIYGITKEKDFKDQFIGASFSIYNGQFVEDSDSLMNFYFQSIYFDTASRK